MVGFIFASYVDSFIYIYIGKNTGIIFYNKLKKFQKIMWIIKNSEKDEIYNLLSFFWYFN